MATNNSLNIDYKTASKVIAIRIEKLLTHLINPDQTAFIKGRYIGQNVRLISDTLAQTKLQNTPWIQNEKPKNREAKRQS